jgi:hypothetical protein
MTLAQYIDSINNHYRLGNSTEHTFRGDLQHLNSKNISLYRENIFKAIKLLFAKMMVNKTKSEDFQTVFF